MKRLLLPLLLALLGTGGGVGAGLALAPGAEAELANPCGEVPAGSTAEGEAGHEGPAESDGHAEPADDHAGEAAQAEAEGHDAPTTEGHDYVRLNNQFVVPVVEASEVTSLVLMSLSVEVPAGQEEAVLLIEPKLRDVFLQVLFDHANTGGFEGMFTAASAMRGLRGALLTAARDEVGDLISDVLVLDLVRQDR